MFDTPIITQLDSGMTVDYKGPEFFAPNNFIYFTLVGECVQDMVYHLEFPSFRGELNDDLDGFYRTIYKDSMENNV